MSQKIKEFIKEIEKYETAEKLIKGYASKVVKKVIDDLNKDTDNNKSRQGFIYEKLWDICIKLGITDLTVISESSRCIYRFGPHIWM